MRCLILCSALLFAACGEGAEDETSYTAIDAEPVSLTERGRTVFKKCQTCHTLAEGAPHKVGPNLWGVFGQTAGAREDFNYSKAMLAADFTWDDVTMDGYLTRPSQYLPGGRMSFVGLKKPEDREAVIAYMREETGAE